MSVHEKLCKLVLMFVDEVERYSNAVRNISSYFKFLNLTGAEFFDEDEYNQTALMIVSRLYVQNQEFVGVKIVQKIIRDVLNITLFEEFVDLINIRSIAQSVSDRYAQEMSLNDKRAF